MHIICLTPVEKGVFNDHIADHITTPPEGWAYIPEDMVLPSTFPRLGSIQAELFNYVREVEVVGAGGETVIEVLEYPMMTVTHMTEGALPEVIEPTIEPTQLDIIEAQVTYTAMMTNTLLEV